MKKGLFATLSIILISFIGFSQQETKVYIKSNAELGKFYVYMDSVLLNRAPQLQVGIVDLEDVESFDVKVVFQNHEKKPISGTIRPKKNKTKLFILYSTTKSEVGAKVDTKGELPIPGDISGSHLHLHEYTGRYGCDFPIDKGVADQVVSQMQIPQQRKPLDLAKEMVSSYCFLTNEYRGMLKVLENDEERIELSKVAWYHLYDQDNFFHLENEFEDSSSMQIILDYVKENQ